MKKKKRENEELGRREGGMKDWEDEEGGELIIEIVNTQIALNDEAMYVLK